MLEVTKVSKRFGELLAVDQISFQASKGEVLGFLGPNGAGKSTTMKVITGFLAPTEGDARVCGHSVRTETLMAQKNLGYVPENAPLYEEMSVREFLEFVARVREVGALAEQVQKMISLCSLKEVEFQKIETLSKGYKRRVSLAQAMIHDPKVLILDEPTDGLDPNQKYDVRELIRQMAQTKCLLVSTHILEEVEEVCHRCIIIGGGKKLFEGSPDDMRAKSQTGRIQDVFRAITTGQKVEGVTV